jgi:hypothetical protein
MTPQELDSPSSHTPRDDLGDTLVLTRVTLSARKMAKFKSLVT